MTTRVVGLVLFLTCYASFSFFVFMGHYSVHEFYLLSASHCVFMWNIVPMLLTQSMMSTRSYRLMTSSIEFCCAGLLVLFVAIAASHLCERITLAEPLFSESSVFMSMVWLLLAHWQANYTSRQEDVGIANVINTSEDLPRVLLVACVLVTFYPGLALLSVMGRPQDLWIGSFLLIGLHVVFTFMSLVLIYEEQMSDTEQLFVELLIVSCFVVSSATVASSDSWMSVACTLPATVQLCAIVSWVRLRLHLHRRQEGVGTDAEQV